MWWKGGGGRTRETIDVEVVWAGETTELWWWRRENSRIVVVVVVEKNNRTVAVVEGKQ